ncbi:glycoside hydrolase family 88 protein [Lysobacter sp. CA199]|uniref:glycoside hydrolase family 88 protein n=1 Tax=Lysobacter sp. CA199 TaxID=3455608 RepID=UPI003F8D335D
MKRFWMPLVAALTLLGACAQQPRRAAGDDMAALIDTQLHFAARQYQVLARNTPPDVMPRSFEKGKPVTSDTRWWTSGFYPGTLWLTYEYTRDPATLAEAERRLAILEKEKHHTGDHDIGFMIFNSFGNAYRITGDARYKAVVDTAAQTATQRYRPAMKSIQSWNSSSRFQSPVIVDNLMNLELLLWAAQNGGDAKLREIAINHADTTLRNHFRSDYSSYHVVDYDPETGEPKRKITAQGAADESAWARGQAWGLYGYTMLYRFTRDPRYLAQARGIASFILDHRNLPADKIPYWDFDAPGIPDALRDASAGAIIASALLELGQYAEGSERTRYVETAATMLRSLAAPPYRAALGDNGGFLLQHSVGSIPHGSEVDVPLTYADYYFVEALLRYRRWYLPKG